MVERPTFEERSPPEQSAGPALACLRPLGSRRSGKFTFPSPGTTRGHRGYRGATNNWTRRQHRGGTTSCTIHCAALTTPIRRNSAEIEELVAAGHSSIHKISFCRFRRFARKWIISSRRCADVGRRRTAPPLAPCSTAFEDACGPRTGCAADLRGHWTATHQPHRRVTLSTDSRSCSQRAVAAPGACP